MLPCPAQSLLLLPGQVAWLLLLLVACCLLLFMAAKMQKKKKHEQRPLCLLRPSPPHRGPVRPFSFLPDIRYRRLPYGEHHLRDAICRLGTLCPSRASLLFLKGKLVWLTPQSRAP